MTEPRSGFGGLVARLLEADARYYEALGRLTSTWLREMAEVGTQVRLPRVTAQRTPVPAAGAVTAVDPVAPAVSPPAAALVLEAVGGQEASGAFLVENTLAHRVQHAVEAGTLTGPEGESADFALVMIPGEVSLDPGEQVVVRVNAVVPASLVGEHRGTVRVAAVPGAEMPVVIRRIDR